jgi:hypothetical protein
MCSSRCCFQEDEMKKQAEAQAKRQEQLRKEKVNKQNEMNS